MKNKASLLGLMAIASGFEANMNRNPIDVSETKETKEEKKERLLKFEEEKKLKRGLKKFFYGEKFVWAINKKNADRKAKNKGLI